MAKCLNCGSKGIDIGNFIFKCPNEKCSSFGIEGTYDESDENF